MGSSHDVEMWESDGQNRRERDSSKQNPCQGFKKPLLLPVVPAEFETCLPAFCTESTKTLIVVENAI